VKREGSPGLEEARGSRWIVHALSILDPTCVAAPSHLHAVDRSSAAHQVGCFAVSANRRAVRICSATPFLGLATMCRSGIGAARHTARQFAAELPWQFARRWTWITSPYWPAGSVSEATPQG
jgi:hypothetical protein